MGVNGHDHKHCENLLDAQMSAPVGAALAMADGDVAAPMFLPDSLARPAVRRLIDLAETRLDEECERLYPQRRSGAVEIGLADGRKFAARVLDPKGEGENLMSDDDLVRKFTGNCAPLIGDAKSKALLEMVWRFEETRDVGNLLGLLA